MNHSFPVIVDLLFRQTYAGIAAILGLISLVILWTSKNMRSRIIAGYFCWIMAFTISDVFAYDYVVLTNGKFPEITAKIPEVLIDYEISINAYRLIQVVFQVVLSFMLLFAVGWRTALATNVFWWGSGCDLLYYLFSDKALPWSWDWLWWTPVGFFMTDIPLPLVLFQASLGAIASILLMYLELRTMNSQAVAGIPSV